MFSRIYKEIKEVDGTFLQATINTYVPILGGGMLYIPIISSQFGMLVLLLIMIPILLLNIAAYYVISRYTVKKVENHIRKRREKINGQRMVRFVSQAEVIDIEPSRIVESEAASVGSVRSLTDDLGDLSYSEVLSPELYKSYSLPNIALEDCYFQREEGARGKDMGSLEDMNTAQSQHCSSRPGNMECSTPKSTSIRSTVGSQEHLASALSAQIPFVSFASISKVNTSRIFLFFVRVEIYFLNFFNSLLFLNKAAGSVSAIITETCEISSSMLATSIRATLSLIFTIVLVVMLCIRSERIESLLTRFGVAVAVFLMLTLSYINVAGITATVASSSGNLEILPFLFNFSIVIFSMCNQFTIPNIITGIRPLTVPRGAVAASIGSTLVLLTYLIIGFLGSRAQGPNVTIDIVEVLADLENKQIRRLYSHSIWLSLSLYLIRATYSIIWVSSAYFCAIGIFAKVMENKISTEVKIGGFTFRMATLAKALFITVFTLSTTLGCVIPKSAFNMDIIVYVGGAFFSSVTSFIFPFISMLMVLGPEERRKRILFGTLSVIAVLLIAGALSGVVHNTYLSFMGTAVDVVTGNTAPANVTYKPIEQ